MKINDIEIHYGYVAVKPDMSSATMLVDLVRSIGIDNTITPDGLHVTLMYSENKTIDEVTMKEIVDSSKHTDIEFKEITTLGNAIVVKINSESLTSRFKELSEYLDHSFDDILLHMSLKYYDSDENTKEDLEKIKPVEDKVKEIVENMVFSNEYFEELS